MFTYINENFLHAPSTDLSRDTVKTLISIMLAQGQEVFLEKQAADGKKVGLLAKLASQAAYLYQQAAEGAQENVSKVIFERVWLLVTQIKANHMASLSQYYQAIADDESNSHGTAIARLQLALINAKDANRIASAFPSSVPASSNLSNETGPNLADLTKRHLAIVQEKLEGLTKDNDFIYHQPVPAEASLSAVSKLPAAKAIPVSELYQGQDIQRIIGPDIFQKIVPMSVTESASLYDEEKAKLVRAEAERVETANGEMAASLDYLKLPGSLNILKNGMDQEVSVDEDFRHWCEDLAGHEPFNRAFEQLQEDKAFVLNVLDSTSKQLDQEGSVCEKMRSKYGGDWTQQPSSRLTSTLRSDIRSYRETIDEAATSDSQLLATARQYESDFDEMRSAGETDEADVLFQRALIKIGANRGKSRNGSTSYSPGGEGTLLEEDYGEGGMSVADQIAKVEDLLKKLNIVKRERNQVLKDLKEKARTPCFLLLLGAQLIITQVHNDDISNVLILNKKSIANQENQLFQAELEKFRPYQNRLVQATHKQQSLMKDLSKTFGALLQDKRVRSEQSKFEAITRQRGTVMSRYKKIYTSFNDLSAGLARAQTFYSEMRETIESLSKNVDTFVNNRRSEGAQLLNQIERDKASNASGQADRERERLRELMERMSMEPSPKPSPAKPKSTPAPISATPYQSQPYPNARSPPVSPRYPISSPQQQQPPYQPLGVNNSMATNGSSFQSPYPVQPTPLQGAAAPLSEGYNPMAYPYQTPVSPPPNQQYFSQTPNPYTYTQPQHQHQHQLQQQHQHHQAGWPPQQQQPGGPHFIPQGYVPPPPPPGPPPSGNATPYPPSAGPFPSGPGGYAQRRSYSGQGQQPQQQQQGQGDPWAGLNAWR
jgi:programmed cell death 6-interacting protein